MKITYGEYINNPMGQGTSVISNREVYKALYKSKYEAIMLREANKIDYKIYKDNKKNTYYIHIKIPSEVIKKFYYDVVIKFIPDKMSNIQGSLKDYHVQFFSNDPSFVFTFAHAFIKNDLFIKELSPRMSREAIKVEPKTKNPKNEIGYVKSLYFAYLVMRDKTLFAKVVTDPQCIPYDLNGLLASIEPADKKIQDRQDAAAKLSAERKEDKVKRKEDIKKDLKHIGDEAIGINNKKKSASNMIKTVKKIGMNNKKVSTVRKSKTIKKK